MRPGRIAEVAMRQGTWMESVRSASLRRFAVFAPSGFRAGGAAALASLCLTSAVFNPDNPASQPLGWILPMRASAGRARAAIAGCMLVLLPFWLAISIERGLAK